MLTSHHFAADALRSSRNEKNDGVTTKIRSYQIIFVMFIENMHSEEGKSVNIGPSRNAKTDSRSAS